ncbi:hypothetical protein [Avibacterium avium]|uniref:hypothetical protein n=1 Tax=Avibacterium avium TaxID=751 RepID=UPI003BF928E2
MKKIMITHPALVVGGAEKVLLDYLQILANSQQPTANSQQPTANSQQPTANSIISTSFF